MNVLSPCLTLVSFFFPFLPLCSFFFSFFVFSHVYIFFKPQRLPELMRQQEEEERKRKIQESRERREAAEREKAERYRREREEILERQRLQQQHEDMLESRFKHMAARQSTKISKVESPVQPRKRYATALYDYAGTDVANALSFKSGNRILLVDCDPDVKASGWLIGRLGGREGLFPASYVKEEA